MGTTPLTCSLERPRHLLPPVCPPGLQPLALVPGLEQAFLFGNRQQKMVPTMYLGPQQTALGFVVGPSPSRLGDGLSSLSWGPSAFPREGILLARSHHVQQGGGRASLLRSRMSSASDAEGSSVVVEGPFQVLGRFFPGEPFPIDEARLARLSLRWAERGDELF